MDKLLTNRIAKIAESEKFSKKKVNQNTMSAITL